MLCASSWTNPYGDEVAAIVAPGSINRNKAWHEYIKGFAGACRTVAAQYRRGRKPAD